MWYTLEDAGFDQSPVHGFVYEFEVLQPIPVKKFIPYISSHPKDFSNRICRDNAVCVHPQLTIRRGDWGPPYDLSVEVTMPLKRLVNEGVITLHRRYVTDLVNLWQHRNVPLYQLRVMQNGDLLYFERK